jgi:glycine oxidase
VVGSDVAVIGGGVIGCACAWMLARAGLKVALYERGALAGEATGASAGILAPLAESHTPGPFADLAVAGLRAFREEIDALVEESGIDPEYRRTGVLRLALDRAAAAALERAAAWQDNHGLGLRWLGAEQVRTFAPELAPSFGGLLAADEGAVRPALLARALATAAVRRGAGVHEFAERVTPVVAHGRATGVQLASGVIEPAGAVLVTGGAWSGATLAELRPAAPVRPVRGQYVLLRPATPPRLVVFGGGGYILPRADGTVYAGATEEPEAGYDRRVTAGGVAAVLAMARALMPSLAEAEVAGMGAGVRPGSVDGLPALGAVPSVERLFVAAGHFRNGVLMSLISGRVLTDLITGREPPLPVAAFSPARFTRASV